MISFKGFLNERLSKYRKKLTREEYKFCEDFRKISDVSAEWVAMQIDDVKKNSPDFTLKDIPKNRREALPVMLKSYLYAWNAGWLIRKQANLLNLSWQELSDLADDIKSGTFTPKGFKAERGVKEVYNDKKGVQVFYIDTREGAQNMKKNAPWCITYDSEDEDHWGSYVTGQTSFSGQMTCFYFVHVASLSKKDVLHYIAVQVDEDDDYVGWDFKNKEMHGREVDKHLDTWGIPKDVFKFELPSDDQYHEPYAKYQWLAAIEVHERKPEGLPANWDKYMFTFDKFKGGWEGFLKATAQGKFDYVLDCWDIIKQEAMSDIDGSEPMSEEDMNGLYTEVIGDGEYLLGISMRSKSVTLYWENEY